MGRRAGFRRLPALARARTVTDQADHCAAAGRARGGRASGERFAGGGSSAPIGSAYAFPVSSTENTLASELRSTRSPLEELVRRALDVAGYPVAWLSLFEGR